MNDRQNALWQVSVQGPLLLLQGWSAAQEACEQPPWLVLSVFEGAGTDGVMTLLFATHKQALRFMAAQSFALPLQVQCAALAPQNWVERSLRALPPVRAGRFVVHGAHHRPPQEPGLVTVQIEAGEAFGSGHHGTTRGCLEAFEEVLQHTRPASVLDLGTGAGTLAIAAAIALPDAQIIATDVDPVAVRVARTNAALNDVAACVRCVVADGFAHDSLKDNQFSLIFANILAAPLKALAPDIAAALAGGGKVVLSGILDTQAQGVRQAFEASGLSFQNMLALQEWRVLVMRRPKA